MSGGSQRARQPALFVSHGAPTLAITDSPARRFLLDYGKQLSKPSAILVLSAHFDEPHATVTAGTQPQTMHDFGGFEPDLYRIRYPAPGSPALAMQVAGLLQADGIEVQQDAGRGFDHGAWVPLLLMFPKADVPVVQLSIDSWRGPGYHLRLGELLRPLRDDNVLILASGSATHNLGTALRADHDDPVPGWVREFRDWLAVNVSQDRRDALLGYREQAPYAARNHPTDEHYLPLLSALGAADDGVPGCRIHASETYGALAMDAYAFGDTAA